MTETRDKRTDAELMSASRGDPGAYREICDRYAERLRAFHLRRTGDRELALDLTAETLAQAWTSRRRFRDITGGSAWPWLVGIARNVLRASVAKGRLETAARERLGILEALDRPRLEAPPDDAWLADLEEALDSLPPSQREAVELRVVSDLGYDEVGEQLGCSPLAARIRVSRGLAALRRHLQGDRS